MTITEIVNSLNELQKLAYSANKKELKEIRESWNVYTTELKSMGYILKKSKYWDGIYCRIKWSAITPKENTRNNECEFIYTDTRPKNRTCLKGDCTTRALTYALNVDYTNIENRQYEMAKIYGGLRNQNKNWGRVAEENGFVKVKWVGCIKRSIIGMMVMQNKINHPLITVSSGHCAVVDKDGSVRDIWDSRGGKVKYLYCHYSDVYNVCLILEKLGIKNM